ncbi:MULTISPECIES: allantoate amidohydrolase [unclassified Spirosoma]|uniref:allantoate amidohydrolase n=1 Tax=unclassified Spirosoma TaxID=2621999 RepID=UPI000958FF59|nr:MULTISPECIES: allantoate amidohydrolase [unclassified Spirosoma]MBN8825593.1 allantoate amidohydrolase [Spirosoma sp.]OJW71702.1 MAG: Zn-dependent hydrolase [Spirosoma sp. 48-14]
MNVYIQRASAILSKIDQLASISETTTGITRTFGSPSFLEGSRLIRQWMEALGLQTRVDTIGSVRGRWASPTKEARTFVIASHMDTVVNAGKFDGPLGIIMGLDLIEQFIQSEQPLPFHIELIAFSDEEGVRFHTTYLGSKVVAGSFDEALLDKKDASGTSLSDVIQAMGGDIGCLVSEAIQPQDWLGYFEIHIEQGPVLYNKAIPVAVVTDIAGQKRVEIMFRGMAGHAGTVPMQMRQDALCAASEFVLYVEQLAGNQSNLVATVGTLIVANAASNVIPGEVICSLDIRSNDEVILTKAYQLLQDASSQLGRARSVSVEWKLIQETASVACDARLTNLLATAIAESGYDVVRLVSGAGHDGVPISQVAPIAMLFVRCFEGISHNPLEQVELTDLAAALEVADQFMKKLITL